MASLPQILLTEVFPMPAFFAPTPSFKNWAVVVPTPLSDKNA